VEPAVLSRSVAARVALSESVPGLDGRLIDEARNYSLDDFADQARLKDYAARFGLLDVLRQLDIDAVPVASTGAARPPIAFQEKPFEPVYGDLCRLHWLCASRRALSVLEFGSGFSTVVMAHAMRLLCAHHGAWALENTRIQQPFHIHAIEEEPRFVEITRRRLEGPLAECASVYHSSVELALHDSRLTSIYSRLPNVASDLIYLDGPSQYATTQEVHGTHFGSSERMPMSSDLLRIEFFLEPGTLIVVDGRTANARFLKAYFKRNWAYRHYPDSDIHLFELQEEPLGKLNRAKLEFCLGGNWLLR
jgi:hypothetical protein